MTPLPHLLMTIGDGWPVFLLTLLTAHSALGSSGVSQLRVADGQARPAHSTLHRHHTGSRLLTAAEVSSALAAACTVIRPHLAYGLL